MTTPQRLLSPARVEKYRKEQQAITRAAYRLIGSSPDGFASVQDILSEAQLSTRAFYRHFRSKDDLILAMYREGSERVAEEIAKVVAAAPDPRSALAAWIDAYLAVAYDARRAARAIVLTSHEARSAKGFTEIHHQGRQAMRAAVEAILRSGKEGGDFPHCDPGPDARAVLAVVSSLVEARLVGEPGPSRAEASAHTLELFLRAFGWEP